MIWFHETLKSTQDEMKSMAEAGTLSHLDAIYAGVQTGGRGRHGRDWIAPNGNLSASIFLRDFKMPVTWVPLWVGLSLLRVLRLRFPELTKLPGKEVMLKWPNDLVLSSGEKLGGILCEKVESGVIAGIGLNLTTAPSIDGRACRSLGELFQEAKILGFEITGDSPSSNSILEMILDDLRRESSLEDLRAHFLSASIYPVGHAIQWQDSQSGGLRKGRVLGLGLHGELQVELPDGKTQGLFSEEIAGIRNESDSDKK